MGTTEKLEQKARVYASAIAEHTNALHAGKQFTIEARDGENFRISTSLSINLAEMVSGQKDPKRWSFSGLVHENLIDGMDDPNLQGIAYSAVSAAFYSVVPSNCSGDDATTDIEKSFYDEINDDLHQRAIELLGPALAPVLETLRQFVLDKFVETAESRYGLAFVDDAN